MIKLGYIFHFIVFKEEINVSSRAASHPSGFSSYLHASKSGKQSHVSTFYSYLFFYTETLYYSENVVLCPQTVLSFATTYDYDYYFTLPSLCIMLIHCNNPEHIM